MYFQPKKLTASGQVSAGPCLIGGIYVKGGSDAASVALANQAGSGGTEVLGWGAAASGFQAMPMSFPAYFDTACYATITGTSPVVYVLVAPVPGV
jgi:hypothetical protein